MAVMTCWKQHKDRRTHVHKHTAVMRAVMVNFNLMRLPKETIYRYSEI